jgi:hypothetical protein
MMDRFDDAEVLEIERALGEDHDGLCRRAHVPGAGLVWWRATIRARADAARVAEQPIAIAHGIAGASVVGLAFALGVLAWRAMPELLLQHAVPLVAALALCLLVAPLAVALALAKD